ncbi:NgoMIV family type II restriction endonuclease [Corynebacterium sp. HMSC05C01]|uniref:NgoMIV family type II restriction endonuclease n=1 Tax=Corynebacterium sp. HMSC05C01 TaxID=1581113 RepID=UPI000B20744C|nr:NgoMIV family type II restriction endonuclease [Corynebacterium sp. HMSC05C01]
MTSMNDGRKSIITANRDLFHQRLVLQGILSISPSGVASNADCNSKASKKIALHMAESLGAEIREKLKGQSAGSLFEEAVAGFIRGTFPLLQSVRPGEWSAEAVGSSRRGSHVELYEPYRHLADLAQAVGETPQLAAALGNSYTISPDILVTRKALEDEELNSSHFMVDSHSALASPFRAANYVKPVEILHAVISCKFTMRSDRAQNTRAEALNLIRNRKGRSPHIIAVTAEPMLSRISSLALGTGDIDMVYHAALPELTLAVEAEGSDEAKELLEMLTKGNRLRDISDLPLDLVA